MPDNTVLASMYGVEYTTHFAHDANTDDPKEPLKVMAHLQKHPPGVFLDYGCGTRGTLLTEAMRLGWQAIGIEFDSHLVHQVEQRTGARVIAYAELGSVESNVADVLHLGDVLEHLTEMDSQMHAILRLLKPGGLLIAQGPLENNWNLFTATTRLGRRLRPNRRTEMAPYHVMLATVGASWHYLIVAALRLLSTCFQRYLGQRRVDFPSEV